MLELYHVSDADAAAATLRIDQLAERFFVSRQQIYVWIKSEGFPKPVKFHARKVRWIPAQIDAWAKAHTHAN